MHACTDACLYRKVLQLQPPDGVSLAMLLLHFLSLALPLGLLGIVPFFPPVAGIVVEEWRICSVCKTDS